MRAWLLAHHHAVEWAYEYRHLELRALVLRLAALNAASELLGVNLDVVDWQGLVKELPAAV